MVVSCKSGIFGEFSSSAYTWAVESTVNGSAAPLTLRITDPHIFFSVHQIISLPNLMASDTTARHIAFILSNIGLS